MMPALGPARIREVYARVAKEFELLIWASILLNLCEQF